MITQESSAILSELDQLLVTVKEQITNFEASIEQIENYQQVLY